MCMKGFRKYYTPNNNNRKRSIETTKLLINHQVWFSLQQNSCITKMEREFSCLQKVEVPGGEVGGGGCGAQKWGMYKKKKKKKQKKKLWVWCRLSAEGEKSRESLCGPARKEGEWEYGRMFRMKTALCCGAQVCAGSPQTLFTLTAAR